MYEQTGAIYGAYTLIKKEELPNLNGIGYLFSHNKTKARVAVIKNDDDNKVFHIGFRTPPSDDTGVPHITEHTVLCGSKKFPVKDPFVDLAKGSLNTFLNAMTYPDKTVYPVASVNDQDFKNLMDVYLDAVFHPNIYQYEQILKQEGWHYECSDVAEPITYNGVVYNEMKGVFSSPESKVERLNMRNLYPDTPYFYESGGDPEAIPDLTYDAFLDFHRKYYHPSNSYIYLYGDNDVEERLAFIDREYLSSYDYLFVDSEIPSQSPFSERKEIRETYAIAEEEEEKDKTFLCYNVAVGESTDVTLSTAMKILDYVLLNVPGAPLKKALIDAGIGQDISSSYETAMKQPIFSIMAVNANEDQKEAFLTCLMDTLKQIVAEGLNKKSLEAAIVNYEFQYREANFGSYQKGLMYGLGMFDTWLYDDEKAFDLLNRDGIYTYLKDQVATGYFENLIETYLIQNPHATYVIVTPEKGLAAKQDALTAKKLAAYKETLSEEEVAALVKDNEALHAFQDREDSEEDKAKLPVLKISDIEKKVREQDNEEMTIADTKVVKHSIFTNGISYVSLLFDMRHIPAELLPVSSLLVGLFKEVDTEHYTYQELASEINLHTGGIGHGTSVYKSKKEPNGYGMRFSVRLKCFHQELEAAFALMKEIYLTSDVVNEKRIREIVAENKVALRSQLLSSGHTAMANRALSCFDEMAAVKERTDLYDYYNYLVDLENHFEERKEQLKKDLQRAVECIFTKENLLVSVTSDQEVKAQLEKPLSDFTKVLYPDQSGEVFTVPLSGKTVGIMTPSKVQYVACAGNFMDAGQKYSGAMLVLKMIFSYEYLWMNIRVKGGAYGCGCTFSPFGNGYFTSYRDPNLSNTYQVYEKAAEYVAAFNVDARAMNQYIIGAISMLDQPLTPSSWGTNCMNAYLQGITKEERQQERGEVLACDQEKIRALAPAVAAIYEKGAFATLGNQEKIKEEQDYFEETVLLR